jgi:predicted negative regulator of RcsB-dependent stress response
MEKKKVYELLIDAHRISTTRSRQVFAIINIITVVFLLAYFNYRWTWQRHSVEFYGQGLPYKTDTTKVDKDIKERQIASFPNYESYNREVTMDEILRKKTRDFRLENEVYVTNRFVNLNFIGSKIYIDDLPTLGGLALGIVMTWFYYLRRRELGVVRQVRNYLREQKETDPEVIAFVYFGISFNQVFNTVMGTDEKADSKANNYQSLKSANWKIMGHLRRLNSFFEKKLFTHKLAVNSLVYAPVFILILIVVHDTYETFWNETLMSMYWKKNRIDVCSEIIILSFLTFGSIWYNWSRAKKITSFSIQDKELREEIEKMFNESKNKSNDYTGNVGEPFVST